MRIAIVATHAHPLPAKARTGDSQVILDLCWSLNKLGHEVTLFAPSGTIVPDGVECCWEPQHNDGNFWENEVAYEWHDRLIQMDVVHDWSINKGLCRWAHARGRPFIGTTLGGTGYTPFPNAVAQSHAMRDRMMRGASDYEGSATPEMGGPPCEPFKEMRVVHNGIDTEFYRPTGQHEDWFLWLSRWHPVRGYRQAIEWAKTTGKRLVMAGEHPDNDHPYQAGCCREAMALADGARNIEFVFLPPGDDHHQVKRDLVCRAYAMINPFQFAEPFGLSQIEAPACGVPVISSALGSGPEVVLHGVSGFVASDADDFVRQSKRIGEINRDGCRAYVVEKFDRILMARNYVELYEAVIRGEGWGA